MEKKYLNEETYRKGKKGLTIAAIVVIAIGLLIGGFLIFNGINKANGTGEKTVEELKKEKSKLNEELIPYEAKKNEEFLKNGFSEEYYRLDNKIDELRSEITDIEREISKANMGFRTAGAMPFFMFGGFIIIASLMIGGSILMMAHRRNIMAFSVQQAMPVVKEGIDEIAPVIGSAAGKMAEAVAPSVKKVSQDMAPVYGDVAKEISKGIKEGLKDKDDK